MRVSQVHHSNTITPRLSLQECPSKSKSLLQKRSLHGCRKISLHPTSVEEFFSRVFCRGVTPRVSPQQQERHFRKVHKSTSQCLVKAKGVSTPSPQGCVVKSITRAVSSTSTGVMQGCLAAFFIRPKECQESHECFIDAQYNN